MVARLLQDQGLPPGLTSVVAVESAFNPLALSPKGARGLWQLMPDTARRYGLRVEWNDDERTNPLKATRAAAAYMKDLFAQFQDWPLALAAYNAGEDRVSRALTQTGAQDFWTLRRRRALPAETLQYVPAVLEKLESPLDAPVTEHATSSDAPGHSESPAGRIAYATPAVHE
jgi:membrane-bound lytic murein transglycosylase D